MRVRCFTGGPFQENAYLLDCEQSAASVIVDPGGGTPQLLETVRADGRSVEAVILTHAHLDHVDGIPAVRAALPDVPIYLHPDDRMLYDAAPEQARAFGMPVPVLPEPDVALVAGDSLAFGEMIRLAVAMAPGHAPGHVILVDEAGAQALVGDVIFAGSIGRTDLPGGDYATLMNSIRREILALDDPVRLFPGHGPATTVGRERQSNPFVLQALSG